MSTVDEIREEARVARKWAGEKGDWLDNPQTRIRYKDDPHSLQRRHDEMMTMFRAAERWERGADTLEAREAKVA